MPTVNLGRVRMKWRGEWAGSTAYAKDDIVRHGTDTYVATTAHTSHATTFSNDSANWELMAQGSDIPSQSGQTGNYLQTDGSTLSWAPAESAGRLLGIEVLGPYASISAAGLGKAQYDTSASASGTWTRPAGCNSVLVYVTGGGGGGRSDDSSYRGGTGAGGGTAIKFIENVTSTVSWTVGGGGAGARGGEGNSPNNGGTSSFGSYCSGYGGEGGQGNAAGQYGASGGGASGGDLNIIGGGGLFNHTTATDSMGGASFWTQAGSQHHIHSPIQHSVHGKMGSGGGIGQNVNDAGIMSGGSGLILIHKYS